jgi:hypothetical protein
LPSCPERYLNCNSSHRPRNSNIPLSGMCRCRCSASSHFESRHNFALHLDGQCARDSLRPLRGAPSGSTTTRRGLG